jgi:hypothetical protein
MNFIKSRTGVSLFAFVATMLVSLPTEYFFLSKDQTLLHNVISSLWVAICVMLAFYIVLPKINPVLYNKRKNAKNA